MEFYLLELHSLECVLHQDECYLGYACDLDSKQTKYLRQQRLPKLNKMPIIQRQYLNQRMILSLSNSLNNNLLIPTKEKETPTRSQ